MQLTYSSLPPGKRRHTPPAAFPRDEELAPGAPRPIRASRGAWPHPYHRVLNAAFLAALFALSVLLGTVVSRYAASFRSSSMPSRPSSLLTPAARPAIGVGGVPVPAAVDARFAIVTLDIQCLRDTCDESQYVPAGQRVYALQAGVSCTSTTPLDVVGHHEQYAYCRLDQLNVFAATFDGAPFECVGSRLGCHFVVQVETTNVR